MTAANAATEAVADAAEEVAEQALNVADASRGLSGRTLGISIGAFLVGSGIGGGLGYVLTRRRLEAKYAQIADDEIAGMREHYHARGKALEAEYAKRPVEEIVKARGYSSPDADATKPPMAVQPPEGVVESEDEKAGEPPEPEPEVRNVFREHGDGVEFVWDYHEERKRRSPGTPYVIHYDERDEMEYQIVTLTYYDGDDVLCDERDNPVDPDERNNVVGEGNLDRFGHGSNDPAVVYIRNDKLELVYEVVKSPNSFAEEVHGFSHGAYDRGNVERMRARERDVPEE